MANAFSKRLQQFVLILVSVAIISCGGATDDAGSSLDSSSSSLSANPGSTSSSLSLSSFSSASSTSSVSSSSSSSLSSLLSSAASSTSSVTSSSSSLQSSTQQSSSEASFRPVALTSEINRVQPMTGIVFWSENSRALTALGNDIQLEFSYLLYSDVATTTGVYDWSVVDSKLAQAAARGHQMILRFRDTYPGITRVSIPSNLPSMISSVEGKNTFIPDWSSTNLHEFIIDFFTRFAQRYDNDPRLAFIQLGFGSYAEYHLYDGNLQLGSNFPDKAFQERFFNHVSSVFSKTPWSISIDAADSNHSAFGSTANATTPLKNLAFGLFDDSFMHQSHSVNEREYNRSSWLFFGGQRYQSSPAGGEFSYYSSYDQEHVLDKPNGPHGRVFEDFASQYKITYIIGNDQYNYQTKARIKEAAMATGYQFHLTKFESNGSKVRFEIANKGIAPIYYNAYPTVNGQVAEQSLKGLQPGNTIAIEMDIGEHDSESLSLTIESDRLVNGQVIQYHAEL